MNIWVLESSSDGGKTWTFEQRFGMYKTKQRAEARAAKETDWHVNHLNPAAWCFGWKYRAREYTPLVTED